MPRWSRFDPSADRRLVRELHDGDADALATLYDVYSERLYDYCLTLLDDSKAATDVVHDTFVDAARRAPRLRERERLRPWLYAAARRRCLTRKRPSKLRGISVPGLDVPHQEALFLATRHDLTGESLAATLGIAPRRAQARLVRSRRHIADADEPFAAEELFNAPPAPVLPAALRHRVLHTGTDSELAGYRAEISARGGALTTDGLPRQPDAPSGLVRRWSFVGGGSLAALAGTFVALLIIGPDLPGPDLHWPSHTPGPSAPLPPSRNVPGMSPSPEPGPTLGSRPGRPGAAIGPPTSAPPMNSAPIKPGVLVPRPTAIHFGGGGEKIANLRITAADGPVTWTIAESSPQISVSSMRGALLKGEVATVQVSLQRGVLVPPGQTTVEVTDGRGQRTPVTVTWDLSVL